MQQIELVCGHEPMREGEFPIVHAVGSDGVTRIEYSERLYGTYGVGEFHVYKGDKIFATMTHLAVAEIRYFPSEST